MSKCLNDKHNAAPTVGACRKSRTVRHQPPLLKHEKRSIKEFGGGLGELGGEGGRGVGLGRPEIKVDVGFRASS